MEATSLLFVAVARCVVGAAFGLAAFGKLRDRSSLVAVIRAHQIVPDATAVAAAHLLIAFEGAVAVGHLSGAHVVTCAWSGAALLGVFAIVTVRAIAQGRHVECNCFGPDGDNVSIASLVRIGVLGGCEALVISRHSDAHVLMSASASDVVACVVLVVLVLQLLLWMPRLERVVRSEVR
jgi:hypothetical protein